MSYLTKCKKALMILLVCVIVSASFAVPASAVTTYKVNKKTSVYTGTKSAVYYQGKKISGSTRYGIYYNDNFMIPYHRFLVKKGPKVKSKYNKITKVLQLTYGKKIIKMILNSKKVYVNGVRKSDLNTAPFKVTMEGSDIILVPAKRVCALLGLDYSFDRSSRAIYISKPVKTSAATPAAATTYTGGVIKATAFKNMTTSQFISLLGPIAQEDYHKTGVLASVTLAQAINESGWGRTTLAQKGNNIFGMKTTLSGNTWSGSAWDGKSYVSILTTEEYGGRMVKITARFRKYDSVARSIADHSAYLINAKNGLKNRYYGLASTKSYAKQLQILQKGGYCTWSSYRSELTSIIKRYNLTKYDK